MVKIKNSSFLLIQRIVSSIGVNKMKILILLIVFTKIIISQDFQISEVGNVSFAPQISADSAGNFVVVWTDYRNSYENGGIDSGSAIYGQLYLNSGIKLRDNFRISEDILGGGNRIPSVSMNSKGNFVVTWYRSNDVWSDTDIYARIFNKDGLPQTQSFKVNHDTTNKAQLNAKVILQEKGNFIITWLDRRDDYLFSYAQLFDSLGNPIGGNFKVNRNNIEGVANICLFKDDKFLFQWGGYIQIYNEDGTLYSDIINIGINGISYAKGKDSILVLREGPLAYEICGSFFDLNGNQISQSFKINDDILNSPIGRWDVAFFDERFIIVWQDHRNDFPGIVGNGDIYAQRFNLLGEKIGENFKVNHEVKELTQRDPSVILYYNNFIVAWLDIYPKCFPLGTAGINISHIMGTIQEFSNPIPGEVFGWETLKDSCNEEKPSENKIFNNYPNPFNTETNINFSIKEDSFLNISVYNILGEKVKTLINDFLTAEEYKIKLNGSSLPSGIYIVVIRGSNFTLSLKTVLTH